MAKTMTYRQYRDSNALQGLLKSFQAKESFYKDFKTGEETTEKVAYVAPADGTTCLPLLSNPDVKVSLLTYSRRAATQLREKKIKTVDLIVVEVESTKNPGTMVLQLQMPATREELNIEGDEL